MAAHRVEVVCHRGANAVAPENTWAAARQCVEWGADYIEVDVRTSRDGVFYVLHDAAVDRTTNGTGRLRDLTSDEIDRLDAGAWFHPRFSGERIPRLEPFLERVRGKAKVFFDVKDADLSQLLTLVHTVGRNWKRASATKPMYLATHPISQPAYRTRPTLVPCS